MKRHVLLFGILSLVGVSCTVNEISAPVDEGSLSPSEKVYFAAIDEQPGDVGTKTYTDETLHIFWNADDHITIFENVTGGLEFTFKGEDGATGGTFRQTYNEYAGGESLDGMKYAVYPYKESTSISHSGVISFDFPSVQTYRYRSFGRGDNTMVSKTDDSAFRFKSVGGFLVLKLYGSGVTVSAITLKNENGRPIAGRGSIDQSGEDPIVTMDTDNSTDEILLKCAEPVVLGATADDYTEFWFVLPPVEFTKADGGFTFVVYTDDGGIFEKKAKIDLSVVRNRLRRIAPIEVTPTPVDISINEISATKPTAKGDKKYVADLDGDTFTITLPTVTDFSEIVLDYDLVEGDVLMCDGVEIESGVTPIDASGEDGATLVVHRGYAQKSFTLKARNTGLPVVRINTNKFTLEEVEADADHEDWFEGATIKIEDADGSVILDYTNSTDTLWFRGRGNATWTYDKRPYALKFNKAQKVSNRKDMPKHKRWVLLANWKDRTLLRNDAAFWLSKKTGLAYTVSGQYVELEINGAHRGNYYLCEQIKIHKNRLNITEMAKQETDPVKKTGGFLMEIDNNYDEANKFISQTYSLKYMFKDPDDEDLSAAAKEYMEGFINTVETKIKKAGTSSEYRDYFDIDSAIWFMFVNELTGNGDFYNTGGSTWSGPHSTYLYKDVNTLDENGNQVISKLHMGPVWDFDYLTFMPSRYSGWYGVTQSKYYFNDLRKDKTGFNPRVRELWSDYYTAVSGLTDYIDEMADYIRLSDQYDAEMWWKGTGYQTQNGEQNYTGFQQSVDKMKEGFTKRLNWMNSNINSAFPIQ